MGKSKPQDELKIKIEELYPYAYVTDEVYIKDLIEQQGYSVSEISRELGNDPHRMFCDIILRESDRTIAFEYHGEQHYSLVGNMTKTTADLMMNQMLDREKSWILSRIGVPLVAIPFDMYIDERVIENLIEEATDECEETLRALTECPECQRLFPQSEMPQGICKQCWDKIHSDDRSSSQDNKLTRSEEVKLKRKAYAKEQYQKRKAAQKKRKQALKEPDYNDESEERINTEIPGEKVRPFERFINSAENKSEPKNKDIVDANKHDYENSNTDNAVSDKNDKRGDEAIAAPEKKVNLWAQYAASDEIEEAEHSDDIDDDERYIDELDDDYNDKTSDYAMRQKERAKELRKQRYNEYKNSDEYRKKQEEAKRKRKEAYQRQKAEKRKFGN